MKIDENYSIEQDQHNVILTYEKVTDKVSKKSGELIVSRDRWYYKNIEDALKGYLEKSVDANADAEVVLSQIQTATSKIAELSKTISA